jgi:hypothetical protein
MSRFAAQGSHGLLLQAEVAPGGQSAFEQRYLAATSRNISPGSPRHYQAQMNKWGAELRVYFDDPGMAVSLAASGLPVEYGRRGYLAGKYRYRVNNNEFWWALVENHGLRLGSS